MLYSKKKKKKNLGAQEPWVDFCTYKCDKEPLRTTSLTSTRSSKMVVFYHSAYKGSERMAGILRQYFFEFTVNEYQGLIVYRVR